VPRVRGTLPLVGSFLVASAAVALLAYSSTLNPVDALLGRGAMVSVPDVEGRALPRARAEIEAVGLRVESRPGFSLSVPRGAVIRQDPAAADRVREGEVVELVVSQGANRVEMPDAVGKPLEQAVVPLEESGVEFEVEEVPDERVPEGVVLAQEPDPGVVVTGEDVPRFEVSTGPPPRPVPEVLGLSLRAAAFRIGEAGLQLAEVTLVDDPGRPVGAVASIEPAVGTMLERDAAVTIGLSTGPPPVEVPDVTNIMRHAAIDRLEARGFVVQTAGRLVEPGQPGIGNVYEQRPEAGAQLRPGETVTIVVGRPPPDPPPPPTTTTTTTTTAPPAPQAPPRPPGGGG
jgi:beta-lactam-binding protein with PASTA domain